MILWVDSAETGWREMWNTGIADDTTLATIMVTFYSEIAYPLVTVFYWAKHNPKDIFESTIDLYY